MLICVEIYSWECLHVLCMLFIISETFSASWKSICMHYGSPLITFYPLFVCLSAGLCKVVTWWRNGSQTRKGAITFWDRSRSFTMILIFLSLSLSLWTQCMFFHIGLGIGLRSELPSRLFRFFLSSVTCMRSVFHIRLLLYTKKKNQASSQCCSELCKYAVQATHTLEMSHSATSLNHLLWTAKPEFATAHHSKVHWCQQLSPARISCVRHLIYTTFEWQHNLQFSTSK